jgi:hypothetical protein
MKRILFISILMACMLCTKAQTYVNPSVNTRTSFAIIVDRTTYQKAKEAVDAYRKVVEKDGLATYIIYDDWKSPEQIRDILIKLHKQKNMMLEGAVLVGDIPIAMLRDAQHLTSAFKMNQTRDWKQSSVPSDRYYDDFGLKFKFIKEDADRKEYFYYSLLPESEQHLKCDIYTARIRPLDIPERDRYRQISDFLNKVVRERTNNANNVIDCMSMARGHGYNSEDEAAWAGEQIALREQMASLFKSGHSMRFIDFESVYPPKYYYLNEVQRPGLDIMLFHHHGEYDTQYLSGYKNGSDITTSIENAKRFIRNKVAAAATKKGKEAAIAEYAKSYDVPRSWCEEAFDSTKVAADSLYSLNENIITTDLRHIKPTARFIMFDACYNGSFYQKDYIAGNYIFADGTTLVTQANTVNTIQDKWPDEMIGLLNAGMRIGEWHRHVCFLETHLLGDPTYHFAVQDNPGFNINEASVTRANDAAFWRTQLNNKYPDVRAMAVRKLSMMNIAGLSDLLKSTYYSSPYMVVRLEAFRRLALLLDKNYVTVLKSALTDSYELTRRFAAKYAEQYGSDVLTNDVANALVTNYTDSRVAYNLEDALEAFSKEPMKAAMRKAIDGRTLYYKTVFEGWLKRIDGFSQSLTDNMNEIMSAKSTEKRKISDISYYRNHPNAAAADNLLHFVADTSFTLPIRRSAAEALGWYNQNYRRDEIANKLKTLSSSVTEQELKDEISKSIRRLSNL